MKKGGKRPGAGRPRLPGRPVMLRIGDVIWEEAARLGPQGDREGGVLLLAELGVVLRRLISSGVVSGRRVQEETALLRQPAPEPAEVTL